MNSLALYFTRNSLIPINIRRKIGNLLFRNRNQHFTLSIDDRVLQGHLDNYIDRTVFITGNYFEYTYLNLLKKWVKGDGCVLDIGANVGNHSTHFSTYFEEVLSFEPFPPVFEELRRRTEGIDNIVCHQLGVGSKTDVLKFQSPKNKNLGTGMISKTGDIEVKVMSGDGLVEAFCKRPVRMIKIDTEGYELEVLQGLQQTLTTQRPVIVFEVPKSDKMSRSEGYKEASKLIPEGYSFYGLRSQSTFPIQVQVARPIKMTRNQFKRGCKVALAIPDGTAFGGDRLKPQEQS